MRRRRRSSRARARLAGLWRRRSCAPSGAASSSGPIPQLQASANTTSARAVGEPGQAFEADRDPRDDIDDRLEDRDEGLGSDHSLHPPVARDWRRIPSGAADQTSGGRGELDRRRQMVADRSGDGFVGRPEGDQADRIVGSAHGGRPAPGRHAPRQSRRTPRRRSGGPMVRPDGPGRGALAKVARALCRQQFPDAEVPT